MRFFIATAASALCSFCAAGQSSDSITADQVRADLDFIGRSIESVHPDPWHSTSRKSFNKVRDSISATLPQRIAVYDEWPYVARLCAVLNEGHTNAETPPSVVQAVVGGSVPLFPVSLSELRAEGFVVRADFSEPAGLQEGDRITAINGVSTQTLYARLASLYGGLPAWRQVRIQSDPTLLLFLAGVRGPFRFEYTRGGRAGQVTEPALSYKEFKPRRDAYRAQHPVPARSNSFERLEGNIGLLRFNTMSADPKAFDSFLVRTFDDIRVNPVKGLLIDMRKNGGGNSVLGWYLLQYITSKPFRMSGGVRWKVSPEVRAQVAEYDSARRAGFASYLEQPDGYIFKSNSGKPETPDTNYLRYTGKVGVLIGPNTFSSANMTVNAIGDYGLATLIGEPSGEPANDYGELVVLRTPNAQIPFTTCSKYFIRANGDARNPNPVLPDIMVRQDPNNKEDTVLEAAKKWVTGK